MKADQTTFWFKDHFYTWRGTNQSRLEDVCDGIFAFASMCLAVTLSDQLMAYSGLIYFLLGPLHGIRGWWSANVLQKMKQG